MRIVRSRDPDGFVVRTHRSPRIPVFDRLFAGVGRGRGRMVDGCVERPSRAIETDRTGIRLLRHLRRHDARRLRHTGGSACLADAGRMCPGAILGEGRGPLRDVFASPVPGARTAPRLTFRAHRPGADYMPGPTPSLRPASNPVAAQSVRLECREQRHSRSQINPTRRRSTASGAWAWFWRWSCLRPALGLAAIS